MRLTPLPFFIMRHCLRENLTPYVSLFYKIRILVNISSASFLAKNLSDKKQTLLLSYFQMSSAAKAIKAFSTSLKGLNQRNISINILYAWGQ